MDSLSDLTAGIQKNAMDQLIDKRLKRGFDMLVVHVSTLHKT